MSDYVIIFSERSRLTPATLHASGDESAIKQMMEATGTRPLANGKPSLEALRAVGFEGLYFVRADKERVLVFPVREPPDPNKVTFLIREDARRADTRVCEVLFGEAREYVLYPGPNGTVEVRNMRNDLVARLPGPHAKAAANWAEGESPDGTLAPS